MALGSAWPGRMVLVSLPRVWCWMCSGWLLGPGSFALGFGLSSGLRQIGFGKAWSGVTDLQQVAVAVATP